MNGLQKWLIVIAIWIFSLGVLLNSFGNRYRLPVLLDEFTLKYPDARYDTWTGRLQVWVWRDGGIHFDNGSTSWIRELK